MAKTGYVIDKYNWLHLIHSRKFVLNQPTANIFIVCIGSNNSASRTFAYMVLLSLELDKSQTLQICEDDQ
jgi:hypothetical protein